MLAARAARKMAAAMMAPVVVRETIATAPATRRMAAGATFCDLFGSKGLTLGSLYRIVA